CRSWPWLRHARCHGLERRPRREPRQRWQPSRAKPVSVATFFVLSRGSSAGRSRYLRRRERFEHRAAQFFRVHKPRPVADDDTLAVDQEQRWKDRNSAVSRVAILRPMNDGEINLLFPDVPLTHPVVIAQAQEAVGVGGDDGES